MLARLLSYRGFITHSLPGILLCLSIAGTLLWRPVTLRAQGPDKVSSGREKLIVQQLQGLRKLPDGERAKVTKRLAFEIRKLPAGASKVGLANDLANLATEGDFGRATLQEVATTLEEALRQQPDQPQADQPNSPYSELARLAHYEHVRTSLDNPQMAAATARLEAEDRDRRQADFTLGGLDGKTWTLKSLRGKVVLVNFWATWCPPCRKEMPDLDTLYHRFQKQGLVILAISDENANTVNRFLAAHPVSYPILLDPGRKVNELFHVYGIPKSFVYDRTGTLVAESIDMRTQKQFLAMLGQADPLLSAGPPTPLRRKRR